MFDAILTPEEHRKWVEEIIIPTFTKDRKASAEPTFVLLTGQSGAGKSYSSMQYARRCLSEAPVRFGADDIRILHPRAMEILKTDQANYAFLTKKDAGLARAKLIEHCFDKKYNVLVESVLLSPDDYKMPTLLQAREQGYRVECMALGVHRNLSEVSIYSRQEEQWKLSGVGFPATLDVHNRVYELMPDILVNMCEHGTVDRLSIYNRRFECFFDSNKEEGNPILIRERLMRARNSHLNQAEMTNVALKWENVIRMMEERGASKEDRETVSALFHNFLKKTGLIASPQLRSLDSDRTR